MIVAISNERTWEVVKLAGEFQRKNFTTESRRHRDFLKYDQSRESLCISQSLLRASVSPWLSQSPDTQETSLSRDHALAFTSPRPSR